MKGLEFFKNTNARDRWVLASWHNPKSLTWSWCVYFRLIRKGERRFWPILSFPKYGQEKLILRVPMVGFLSWLTQQPLWRTSVRCVDY